MLTDKEWEGIRYSLVETGFFDLEARPKTLKAVRRVLERMSHDEIETLEEKVCIIFAPAPSKHGEVFPFVLHASPPNVAEGDTVMVYLSPEIEKRSQKYVESVVAHEFAHVLLHPFDDTHPPSIEREADEKVQEWGFKPAYDAKDYPNQ